MQHCNGRRRIFALVQKNVGGAARSHSPDGKKSSLRGVQPPAHAISMTAFTAFSIPSAVSEMRLASM